MTRPEFYAMIAGFVDCKPSTIQADSNLEALGWDSMAVLDFIAKLDEQYDIRLSTEKIQACVTVADLEALLGAHVTA